VYVSIMSPLNREQCNVGNFQTIIIFQMTDFCSDGFSGGRKKLMGNGINRQVSETNNTTVFIST